MKIEHACEVNLFMNSSVFSFLKPDYCKFNISSASVQSVNPYPIASGFPTIFDFSVASRDNWKIECFPTTTTHTKQRAVIIFLIFKKNILFYRQSSILTLPDENDIPFGLYTKTVSLKDFNDTS